MSNAFVTINLVVLNGEKYIRHCFNGILAQTYPHELIEFNVLDNGSTDGTPESIKGLVLSIKGFLKFNLIESKQNLGMWPGQEELLKYSNGKYTLAMAVDVILNKDFIKNAIEVMERDDRIGALQAKIYKYDVISLPAYQLTSLPANIIDTCGFKIERSRRVTNIGHGKSAFAKATEGEERSSERFDFNKEQEIFGVEGACPFFRKRALENCRLFQNSTKYAMAQSVENYDSSTIGEIFACKIEARPRFEIFDHDYFWYGDDLDLAWRMNLFGWKQIFAPSVIAWHDRQTTKSLKKNWLDHIARVPTRHQIPEKKRRLDWRNLRWTIIKNDYTINILRDLPYILWRELMVFGYTFLFEPRVFMELPNFIKLIPKMLRKRREIMKRAVVKPEEMGRWFE